MAIPHIFGGLAGPVPLQYLDDNFAYANSSTNATYSQGAAITAGSFVVGQQYVIATIGSTNFTTIGAASNTVGVQFTATGVGVGNGTAYLVRTVTAKLQESVSVLDFGADPTGVADSTAAIQNAITASRYICLPAGTYKITSTLLVPANTVIYGAGLGTTTIQIAADVVGIRATGFYVTLHDFAVTKSGAHTSNGIDVGDSTTSNAGRFSIRGVSVTSMGNDGLRIRQGNIGNIEDCSFITNGRDGIHFGIETANTNAWTIDGYVSCLSNVRDGINFEQGSSQNDALASRSHTVSSINCQTNGRYGLYCGTPGNVFTAYLEASTTADLYLDTYAYGNYVTLTQAGVITDVGAATNSSYNVIVSQNGGANKWRQFNGRTLFQGGVLNGIGINGDDGTPGSFALRKSAARAYRASEVGSSGGAALTTFDTAFATKHTVAATGGFMTSTASVSIPTGVATTVATFGITNADAFCGVINVRDSGGTNMGATAIVTNFCSGGSQVLLLSAVSNSTQSASALTVSGGNVQFSHTFGSTRTFTVTLTAFGLDKTY